MIDKIIEILRNDGLVALPTDTIYGLIGNPFSEIAVERAYSLKCRDKSKKLSIFVNSVDKIKDICVTNEFIDKFIENDLKNNTIILEKKNKDYLNLVSDNKIGIRIPDNEFIIELLNKYNKPVFATSINLSNEKECLIYSEVLEKFGNKIDLIVKNKTSSSNKPSNIFVMEKENIVKIR